MSDAAARSVEELSLELVELVLSRLQSTEHHEMNAEESLSVAEVIAEEVASRLRQWVPA